MEAVPVASDFDLMSSLRSGVRFRRCALEASRRMQKRAMEKRPRRRRERLIGRACGSGCSDSDDGLGNDNLYIVHGAIVEDAE